MWAVRQIMFYNVFHCARRKFVKLSFFRIIIAALTFVSLLVLLHFYNLSQQSVWDVYRILFCHYIKLPCFNSYLYTFLKPMVFSFELTEVWVWFLLGNHRDASLTYKFAALILSSSFFGIGCLDLQSESTT